MIEFLLDYFKPNQDNDDDIEENVFKVNRNCTSVIKTVLEL